MQAIRDRRFAVLVYAMSSALVACAPDDAPRDSGMDEHGTTITITSARPPMLVAFREGVDGPWQRATMMTPTRFAAEVHGPYIVALVCDYTPASGSDVTTWQAGRTLDEPHELSLPCRDTSTRRTVSGHMVQAGYVQLGQAAAATNHAEWDFRLGILDGAYDLVATSADRIAVRRAIAITGDRTLAPIDVEQEGVALADAAFTAPNATPDETLTVLVGLLPPSNHVIPQHIYTGPPGTAKVAPESVLQTTDIQSASLQAARGNYRRSLRRPFRLGGDATYTLPPPIEGMQWTIDTGSPIASWSKLPGIDHLLVSVRSPNAPEFRGYELDLSGSFVAATAINRIRVDIAIPDFQPAWKVDVSSPFIRQVLAQQGNETETLTSSWAIETAALSVAREGVGHALDLR